jgi:hypothetical protein
MPQITLPDVKMPDFEMPDVKMPDVKMPDALRDLEMPKFDLSKVELPKQITDRLPNRNRRNPFLPIAALAAVGAMVVAAWWLITSPLTGPRIKASVRNLRSLMTDETGLIKVEEDADLGTILGDSAETSRASIASDAYAASNGMSDLDVGVAVGANELQDAARTN